MDSLTHYLNLCPLLNYFSALFKEDDSVPNLFLFRNSSLLLCNVHHLCNEETNCKSDTLLTLSCYHILFPSSIQGALGGLIVRPRSSFFTFSTMLNLKRINKYALPEKKNKIFSCKKILSYKLQTKINLRIRNCSVEWTREEN